MLFYGPGNTVTDHPLEIEKVPKKASKYENRPERTALCGLVCFLSYMIFSRGHRSKFIWSCWIHQYILESGMIYRFRVVRGSFLFLCTRRSRMRSRFQKNKVVPRFSFLFMKCTIWKLLSVLNKRFEIFVTLWRPIYYVSYSTANVKIQSILV